MFLKLTFLEVVTHAMLALDFHIIFESLMAWVCNLFNQKVHLPVCSEEPIYAEVISSNWTECFTAIEGFLRYSVFLLNLAGWHSYVEKSGRIYQIII